MNSENFDLTDLLLNRLKLLSGKDKLMMTMYLEKGNSFRQLARLTSIHEGNIGRRIRKLIKLLINNEYVTCVRNRDKFNAIEIAIAKEYFLTGLSIRQIAAKYNLTYYRTRKILKEIQLCCSNQRQNEGQKTKDKL